MNKRTIHGVEVPEDLSDPRVSTDELKEHRAALAIRHGELGAEGTQALPKRAEIVTVLTAIKDELTKRASLVASEDIGDLLADPEVAPVLAAIVVTPPVNTGIVSEDATLTEAIVDPAAEAEKDRIAAARLALANAAPAALDLGQAPSEQAPSVERKAKTAGYSDMTGVVQDVDKFGRDMTAALTVVANATRNSEHIRDGKITTTRIASFLENGDLSMDELLSDQNSVMHNTRLIDAALARTMERHHGRDKTAAFCAPAEVIRAIPDHGSDASPIRDAITFVPSAAMNFTFNPAMTLASAYGAVTDWNDTNQSGVDPTDMSTWKYCMDFDCLATSTTNCQDWTVACATWPIGIDLSNPQRAADIRRKVLRVKTRRIEQKLRNDIIGLSTTVGPFPVAYSSIPDFVANINSAVAYAGYGERLESPNYVAIIDEQLIWNFMIDRARVAYGVGREEQDVYQQILAACPISGIILAKDRVPGGYGFATGQTISNGNPVANNRYALTGLGNIVSPPQIPTKFEVQLVPLDEVFTWGTGEIRAGAQQDFGLVRQNKVAMFAEEAICMTKYGDQPWLNIQMILCPTGSRTAWTNPIACT